MSNGYLYCFRWKGIPVRLHWAVLALAALQLWNGRSLSGLLGFLVIILVHELGHAVLVARYRLRVHEIHVHPFGGECIHEATHNQRQSVVIAWGGVIAQLLLLPVAFVLRSAVEWPWAAAWQFLDVLIVPNAWMAAFNLLPIRPLDGYTAWQLKHLLGAERLPKRMAPARRPSVGAEREKVLRLVDDALEEARTGKKAPADKPKPE